MKAKFIYIAALASLAITPTSCEKVSPQGVLMAGTGVEDRVEMSYLYYKLNNIESKLDIDLHEVEDGYSFLVGADSHMTTDPGRTQEMLQIGLDNDDLFYCHLGDIADTKAEYYVALENTIDEARMKYIDKYYYYDYDENFYFRKGMTNPTPRTWDGIKYPFFPVVGNHDLTHNGWALWSNIFGSSFYEFQIQVGKDENGPYFDHFIFLDTASGTLGKKQVDMIEQGVLDGVSRYRFTFVFSHTNIFRPEAVQFSSTFTREETYFLLDQFNKWNASIVFCGHVHAWDERLYNGVYYFSLDSMSERNSPKPGDYLLRIIINKDGEIEYERVRMNYVAKK